MKRAFVFAAVGEIHDGKITRIRRYDAPAALAMEQRMEK